MGLYSGGLIIGRIFASEIWGAYFRDRLLFLWGGGGGAYYRNFTVIVLYLQIFNTQNSILFKISASGLFLKYS